MRDLDTWLCLYGESHQNPINKQIHRVCVPLILLSIIGILNLIVTPQFLVEFGLNFSKLFILLMLIYYFFLSRIFCSIMTLIIAPMFMIVTHLSHTLDQTQNLSLWLSIFIISWIGQFIGHKIEGKKPSFLDDLTFLLIGPLWIVAPLFKKYR